MHIHTFALDGQAFLKKGIRNQSSIPGRHETHQQSKQCWKGEMGEKGPPTDSLCVKDRTGT